MKTFVNKIANSLYYSRLFAHNNKRIQGLLSICADQKSIDIVHNILNAYTTVRKSSEYWLKKASSDECKLFHFTTQEGYRVFGTENPYFPEELFDITEDIVLLDGGAYTGDTIQSLDKLTGGRFRLVYAFEPNKETYHQLNRIAESFPVRVQCFNCGLDDHDGVAPFRNNDAGSRITEDGDEFIDVVDTGKFLSNLKTDLPTFIKLDIEGREQAVINSMKRFIKSYKPDMAISIYHKLEDLWEIPFLLFQICPEYNFFIRHQSNFYTETICYAVSKKDRSARHV